MLILAHSSTSQIRKYIFRILNLPNFHYGFGIIHMLLFWILLFYHALFLTTNRAQKKRDYRDNAVQSGFGSKHWARDKKICQSDLYLLSWTVKKFGNLIFVEFFSQLIVLLLKCLKLDMQSAKLIGFCSVVLLFLCQLTSKFLKF